nr:hypothetical protein [Amycolatopsis sp. CA-230715]
MPEHGVRFHPVKAPRLGQRHHHGEQGRLDDVHPVQFRYARLAAQHRAQRPVDELVQRPLALLDTGAEHLVGVEQFRGHARPLRTLAGEDERGPAGFAHLPEHHAGGRRTGRHRVEAAEEARRVRGHHHRAVFEVRPVRGQGETHVDRVEIARGEEEIAQRPGLSPQRRRRATGQQPRKRAPRRGQRRRRSRTIGGHDGVEQFPDPGGGEQVGGQRDPRAITTGTCFEHEESAAVGQVDPTHHGHVGRALENPRTSLAQRTRDRPMTAGHENVDTVQSQRLRELPCRAPLSQPGGRVVVDRGHPEGRFLAFPCRREEPDLLAAQGIRPDPGVLQGLPGQFELPPPLRCHRGRCLRGQTEEPGVEILDRS